jgi:hypothetical protein
MVIVLRGSMPVATFGKLRSLELGLEAPCLGVMRTDGKMGDSCYFWILAYCRPSIWMSCISIPPKRLLQCGSCQIIKKKQGYARNDRKRRKEKTEDFPQRNFPNEET